MGFNTGGLALMTVITEFSLPAEAFALGQATSGASDIQIQLERSVPVSKDCTLSIWATASGEDQDFKRFEHHLQESHSVKDVETITSVDNSTLYAVERSEQKETFLDGISNVDGVLLEAQGNSRWSFRVRFRDQGSLARFHEFYQTHDYPVNIERVHTPHEEITDEYGFGLTPKQRETLQLAVEEGYFSVPRETNLSELAEKVEISHQALSERVRRGAKIVLQKSLASFAPGTIKSADEASASEETSPRESPVEQ